MIAALPDPDALAQLAHDVDAASERKDRAAVEIRDLIAGAVATHRLDKIAWSLAQRLRKLDDEQLPLTWRQLPHICRALGIEQRATAQGEMFPEPEPPMPNVVAFARPRKQRVQKAKSRKNPQKKISSYGRKLRESGTMDDPVQRAVREQAPKIPK